VSILYPAIRRVSSGASGVPVESTEEQFMSKYVFAFRNDPDRAATPGEEEAWGAWFGELGGAVADFGNRVGRAAMVGASGASPYPDALSGYVVVNADSLESAMQLAQGCPGLRAGGQVEVGEILEM
jgi:hypothetical protein